MFQPACLCRSRICCRQNSTFNVVFNFLQHHACAAICVLHRLLRPCPRRVWTVEQVVNPETRQIFFQSASSTQLAYRNCFTLVQSQLFQSQGPGPPTRFKNPPPPTSSLSPFPLPLQDKLPIPQITSSAAWHSFNYLFPAAVYVPLGVEHTSLALHCYLASSVLPRLTTETQLPGCRRLLTLRVTTLLKSCALVSPHSPATNVHSFTVDITEFNMAASLTANLQSLTMTATDGDNMSQSTTNPIIDLLESDTAASLTSYPASSASRPSSASSAPSDDLSKAQLPGAPISPLFEVRDTPTAGRAVFATQDIGADTLLWRAEDLTVFALLREYKREVCVQCFAYDYGRDLRIRDQVVGFAFCSEECQKKWHQETGELGVQAWTEVEKLVKKRSKEDNELVDIGLPRPQANEIAEVWEETKAQAELVRASRMAELGGEGVKITKQHRKAVQKALQQPIQPDVMSFCVSGLVARYNHPDKWEHVLSLAVDSTPYSNADNLKAFTRTYLHLLAILPLRLLSLATPETFHQLISHDSHNSFGIRSLEDEGSEFFGYGCWPSASYFNHSCGPNIVKRREDRVWEFRAAKDIATGEEMNITYLGGEEKDMPRDARMSILRKNWGFDCGCKRCQKA